VKLEVVRGGGEMLTVDRLSVSLSGRQILQEVSFSLGPGEFCGLIGANGSGKTTLLRTILGLQAPSAGHVRFEGHEGPRSVGYVPQKTVFDPFVPLRARDLVALGLDGHRLGLPLPSRKRRALVDEMLNVVDAATFANQRLGTLSGGQQQRLLIVHALIRRPRLLLLDEPLANLDIRGAAEVVAVLHRLCREHKISILVSAHDMNPLLAAMDRIVYLANGHAASGKTEEVVRTEVLSKLYGYHIDVVHVHGRVLVVAAGAPEQIREAVAHQPAHVAQIP
jgi:zinc/manganese transport system ATP-binding protein